MRNDDDLGICWFLLGFYTLARQELVLSWGTMISFSSKIRMEVTLVQPYFRSWGVIPLAG
jgi:hypothetical protein